MTRDRRARLLETLARLQPLGAPIVVVDNASDDGTAGAVAEAFPSVEVVQLDRNRGAAARTAGVRAARTPFVAFCDDDAWWAAGSLEQALAVLQADAAIGLAAAHVLVGPEERVDPVCEAMRASPLPSRGLPGPRVLGFNACAAACRRDAYLACGGFDARYGVGGEEALLALDLAAKGYASVYLAAATAHHHPARRALPAREHRRRDRTALRNDLWTAWRRLHLRDAVSCTRVLLARPGGTRALAAAARDARWVLSTRAPVDAALSRAFRELRTASSPAKPAGHVGQGASRGRDPMPPS